MIISTKIQNSPASCTCRDRNNSKTKVLKSNARPRLRWMSLLLFMIFAGFAQSEAQTNIDYWNLQYPGTATVSAGNNMTAYAQVYAAGLTEANGAPAGISCSIGYSVNNINPSDPSFTWVTATYNSQSGNNDEYQATFGSNLGAGTYYYASRFQRNGGPFYYGGYVGPWGGSNVNAVLTVNCNVAAPGGSASQSFTAGATIADLVASGPGILWYADFSGGDPLDPSTLLADNTRYYASQTINGCEGTNRLNVLVSVGTLPQNIDFVNLQFPASASIATGGSMTAYAQVYTLNVTEAAGAPAGILCWIGYSGSNVNPSDASFTWVAATYNAQSGNNDEYQGTFGSNLPIGTYYYASRFQRNSGAYYYGGIGGVWGGGNISGVLTVSCTAAPTGNANQAVINGATVADLVATGTNIQWYDAATGGNALPASTVLLNAIHYYASQTVAGCESAGRLDVTVSFLSTTLDYYNLQYPFTATIPVGGSATVYAQVYQGGLTEANGAPAGITCWIGYSSNNVNPSDASFTWIAAAYNSQNGNNDEFQAAIGSSLPAGTYYYASRFRRNGGNFYYGGTQGAWGGSSISGVLTVNCNLAAPSGSSSQSFATGATIADLVATGSAIQWYNTASGGTALSTSTVLISGMHYFASQAINNCESASRLDVIVSVTAAPSNIDYANLQYPASASIPVGGSVTAYAQVYTFNVTEANGAPAGITCSIGYSSSNVNPSDPSFTWIPATYGSQVGNNDEFTTTFGSNLPAGTYYYASRFQRNGGGYYYGAIGGFWGGANVNGVLYVNCSPAPTGNSSQSFSTGATVADLVATGTAIQWYAFANGGTVLNSSTTLQNNTHYYASQTIAGCESSERLDVTVSLLSSTLDYYNLQYPFTATISTGGNVTVYAQVYQGGLTEPFGAPAGISSWIGYSTSDVNPSNASFTWIPASYGTQVGNNDEFQASIGSTLTAGTYYYASRFQRNGGAYYYGGTQGAWGGSSISGVLTVTCSIPAVPVISPAGPVSICTGGSAVLASSATSGNQWFKDNAIITGATGTSYTATVAGSYTVTASSGTCASAQSAEVVVTVSPTSIPAPTVTGIVNVCPYIGTGDPITYTFSAAGATSYSYTLPPNVVLVGSTANSITLNFITGFAPQANKQIRVRAQSACGISLQTIYYLLAQLPGTPASITGNTNVCPVIGTATTYSYSIPPVVGAVSYVWTAQAGTTTVTHPNGTGINDVTVNVSFANGFTTSAITVQAVNGCGISSARSLTLTKIIASVPAPVTGPTNACAFIAPGGTAAAYSVPATAGVTYNWTAPQGAIGLTGQGTANISFTYPAGFVSGSVSVTASNGCGTSAARSIAVSKLNPSAPSVIDVIQVSACPDRVYTYSLATMPLNSTSVAWTVPTGATIVSGQGTSSIMVSYPGTAVSGSVTAQSVNNCGSSSIRITEIKLPVCAGGPPPPFAKNAQTLTTATEKMSVKLFPNPSVADFRLQVVTAGKEKISVRILDLQGRVLKQFTVIPFQSIYFGNDLKAGSYLMEIRQGNFVELTKLLKF